VSQVSILSPKNIPNPWELDSALSKFNLPLRRHKAHRQRLPLRRSRREHFRAILTRMDSRQK
jgi:hypothetical protein